MTKGIIFFFLGLFSSVALEAQNIERILEKHFQAHQQDFWEEVRTISIRGVWLRGAEKTRFELFAKKPGKRLVKGNWNGNPYAEAFDGSSGWTQAPWTGVKSPQLMLGKEQLLVKNIFEFGSAVPEDALLEYLGETNESGIPVHRFLEKKDDAEIDYFIDVEDFLLRKVVIREKIAGNVEILSKSYDQYRNFGGIMMPSLIYLKIDDLEKEYVFNEMVVGDAVSNLMFRRPQK